MKCITGKICQHIISLNIYIMILCSIIKLQQTVYFLLHFLYIVGIKCALITEPESYGSCELFGSLTFCGPRTFHALNPFPRLSLSEAF